MSTVTIALVVVGVVIVPVTLIIFGKYLERRFNYTHKPKPSVNQVHTMFDDSTTKGKTT